jgi:SAM-dependent methyltransferase
MPVQTTTKTKQLAMRADWALKSLKDWREYRRRRAAFKAETRGADVKKIEEPVGHRTRHTYRIANGKAFTTFQMDQRWQIVSKLYPEKVTSLLDIGCCRGWFVIEAAMQSECERALGIDVVQGFIDAANEAARVLKLDKAQFQYAFLDDVAGDPQKFRTPYQTIVLLNTYHYMYGGSGYSDKHWADHDYLLRTLANICTDRVIFMSPLEIEECPSDIARRAKEHPEWAPNFTTEKFLETAAKYFHVSHQSYLGIRPLYLMKKK